MAGRVGALNPELELADTNPVFFRSMQIGWRVVLVAAVPTLALLFAVTIQVNQESRSAASSEAELRRIEVLDVLARIQASNVLLELSDVSQRIEGDDSLLVDRVFGMMWEISLNRYLYAEEARAELEAAAVSATTASQRDMPLEVRQAFDRQEAAISVALAAWSRGEVPTSEQIAQLGRTRSEADLALTDLALSSTSDAWIVHVAKVDALRTSWIEYAYLAPTLAGLDVAGPNKMAMLSGQRIHATERVVSILPADLRLQAEAIFDSPSYEMWTNASAEAPAIAQQQIPAWDELSVSALVFTAFGLALEIDVVASAAVDQTRFVVAAEAAAAIAARNRLFTFTALLLILTVGLTLALLRSVVTPIRTLTRRAASIARGEHQPGPLAVGGRDELTSLGDVLDSVADGLRHLDRQVEAIAEGRLDDPSLDIAAPGAVGAHVQQRVNDLREASDALRADAGTDAMTGLLNRRGLINALSGDPRDQQRLVVYIDLDRFKAVNDQYGHKHGDAVLQAVANRLRSMVRPEDAVSRVGGDEFVLVVTDLDQSAVEDLVSRVESKVAEPVSFEGANHRVGCSIGIAVLDAGADLGDDLDRALDTADHRMLSVKSQHRNAQPQQAR